MQRATDCHVDPIEPREHPSDRKRVRSLHLCIAGMGCVNCANRVRNALVEVRGVVDVEVHVISGLATVWYRAGHAPIAELVEAVAKVGRLSHHRYLAVPVQSRE